MLEIKNTEITNAFDGLISSLDMAEEWTNEHEYMYVNGNFQN